MQIKSPRGHPCYNSRIGDDMGFDTSNLGDLSLLLLAAAAAFIAALWLSLAIWTARDIGKRSRDVLSRILAVLVVVLLFIPGLLLYLILRPSTKLEDEYLQTLEEEALLQNIEDAVTCPGCGRRIQTDWVLCPTCHTKLKKPCLNCGKLMELPWNLCPFCAAPAPGYMEDQPEAERFTQDEPNEQILTRVTEEVSGIEETAPDQDWVFIQKPDSEEPQSQSNT